LPLEKKEIVREKILFEVWHRTRSHTHRVLKNDTHVDMWKIGVGLKGVGVARDKELRLENVEASHTRWSGARGP
jgi:hypothetical protein